MDYTEAMRRLLLRKTSQSTLSPEQAEGIVRGYATRPWWRTRAKPC